ncbi:MAG: hypothetical protein ACKOEX_07140 [Planctomycetia bacterium]
MTESLMSSPPEESGGYRPVSAAAVAALVAGIVSAAALVSPVFWVLPLIAIGLAWLGLADVSRPGCEKAGRAAALVGLALAIGFGAQAVSSTAARHWIMSSRARSAALLWVEALREGRIDDAKNMCLAGAVNQLEQFSTRLTACGAESNAHTADVGRNEEIPEQWRVHVVVEPCPSGSLDLDVYVASELATGQEGRFERWKVVTCNAR